MLLHPDPFNPSGDLYDGQMLNAELLFFLAFAQEAGHEILRSGLSTRGGVGVIVKSDGTLQVPIDRQINGMLIRSARAQWGNRHTILGEEDASIVLGSLITVTVDPVDGSGEIVATHREAITAKPIAPGVPIPRDAIRIEPRERTTCVAIAIFEGATLQTSIVYAPYQNKLFVADRQLGAAYLNGKRLTLRVTQAFTQGMAYDYAYWSGVTPDVRFLQNPNNIAAPRRGVYSATMQAADVAEGNSMFAIFPGATVHDIAPGALLLELTGGVVTDVEGNPIDWTDLGALKGAVYSANQAIHSEVIARITAPRFEELPPGYTVELNGAKITAKEVVELRFAGRYGREIGLRVWRAALDECLVVGVRDPQGVLVAIGFVTISARIAFLHDLVVAESERWQGLGTYVTNKRLELIGLRGSPYLYTDLKSGKLGVTPLNVYYERLGFERTQDVMHLDLRRDL